MDDIPWLLLAAVCVIAFVLLFTPYEAILEGTLAFFLVAAVVFGFLLHPRREVFYVRTAVQLSDPDGNHMLEHDLVVIKVELVRLWLLFLPTVFSVAFLVASSAQGALGKFSLLNELFSTRLAPVAFYTLQYLPFAVLLFLWAWIHERWVMRDAEACSARSFTIAGRSVSYLFMGEHGEYYGGYSYHFGFVRPVQLVTVVFYNVRNPDVNKIAMGFLFHRLTILGRGVTDLDKQTAAAQTALAELRSS
jgi:hypothetical protein